MKQNLRQLLEERKFDDIVERAAARKRVLPALVSLTYDSDDLVAWRAVEALGVAAARVAEENPDYVRGQLRRLHWLLSEESGGTCWYAPAAMAEILRRCPDGFPDYIPITISLIATIEAEDLPLYLPRILWAIGRLAPVAGDAVQPVLQAVAKHLDDPESQVRGMAVWCLRQAGRLDLARARHDLARDDGAVDIYSDGTLERRSVRELVGASR